MREGERKYLSSWKVESDQNIARRNNFTEVIKEEEKEGRMRLEYNGRDEIT